MTAANPDICNATALRQAARHISRACDEALAPTGLGINQYAVLARLQRGGPVSQSALAAQLVMDRSTLGHLVRPLMRRGLVSVDTGQGDRRRRMLALSAEGERAYAEARPRWLAVQGRFEDAFGSERAAAMRETLRAVCEVPRAELSTGR